MSKRTRRHYSDEFKAEAVALVEDHGYGVTEAARRLVIDRSNLQRWQLERAGQVKPAVGLSEAENRRLREEVRKLRMERDILKNLRMADARPGVEKLPAASTRWRLSVILVLTENSDRLPFGGLTPLKNMAQGLLRTRHW